MSTAQHDAHLARVATTSGFVLHFGASDTGVAVGGRTLFPGVEFLGVAPIAADDVNVFAIPYNCILVDGAFHQTGGAQGANGPTDCAVVIRAADEIGGVYSDGPVMFNGDIAGDLAKSGTFPDAPTLELEQGMVIQVNYNKAQDLGAGGATAVVGGWLRFAPAPLPSMEFDTV